MIQVCLYKSSYLVVKAGTFRNLRKKENNKINMVATFCQRSLCFLKVVLVLLLHISIVFRYFVV